MEGPTNTGSQNTTAGASPAAVLVRTTADGRKVEVIDGWVCLDGHPEADHLVPLDEHPNRQAIMRSVPGTTHMAGRIPLDHAQAATANAAMTIAQRQFDASEAGINERIRRAVWQRAQAEGVD